LGGSNSPDTADSLFSGGNQDIVLADYGLLNFNLSLLDGGDLDPSTLDLITTTNPSVGSTDVIDGGLANDVLAGGTGDDTIAGGGGHDLNFGENGGVLGRIDQSILPEGDPAPFTMTNIDTSQGIGLDTFIGVSAGDTVIDDGAADLDGQAAGALPPGALLSQDDNPLTLRLGDGQVRSVEFTESDGTIGRVETSGMIADVTFLGFGITPVLDGHRWVINADAVDVRLIA
jgi:Ca2+-binding RTX toxin-like protein